MDFKNQDGKTNKFLLLRDLINNNLIVYTL
jgi:hypothetical protein